MFSSIEIRDNSLKSATDPNHSHCFILFPENELQLAGPSQQYSMEYCNVGPMLSRPCGEYNAGQEQEQCCNQDRS